MVEEGECCRVPATALKMATADRTAGLSGCVACSGSGAAGHRRHFSGSALHHFTISSPSGTKARPDLALTRRNRLPSR